MPEKIIYFDKAAFYYTYRILKAPQRSLRKRDGGGIEFGDGGIEFPLLY